MPRLQVTEAQLSAFTALALSSPTQSSLYGNNQASFGAANAIDNNKNTYTATVQTTESTNWFSVQVPAARCARDDVSPGAGC